MSESDPKPETVSLPPPPLYENSLQSPTVAAASSSESSTTSSVSSDSRPIRGPLYPDRDPMDGLSEPSRRITSRLEQVSSSFKYTHTLIVSSPSSQIEHVQLEDGDWVIPVTITDPVTPGGNCTIHFWTSDGMTNIALPTDLTTENFTYVYGFKELGEWTLGVKPDEDIHEALTALVKSSPKESDNVVTNLIDELKKVKKEEGEPGVSLHLYEISIFSQQEENPFNKEESIWMWTKPNSNYAKKMGFWEKSLDVVVQKGEWVAGRDLKVLVKGVTAAQKGKFFVEGIVSSHYPEVWDWERL